MPPRVYRGFRNVGTTDAVQLTVITGAVEARDDVSMPHSVADQIQASYGDKVVAAFRSLATFDPANA